MPIEEMDGFRWRHPTPTGFVLKERVEEVFDGPTPAWIARSEEGYLFSGRGEDGPVWVENAEIERRRGTVAFRGDVFVVAGVIFDDEGRLSQRVNRKSWDLERWDEVPKPGSLDPTDCLVPETLYWVRDRYVGLSRTNRVLRYDERMNTVEPGPQLPLVGDVGMVEVGGKLLAWGRRHDRPGRSLNVILRSADQGSTWKQVYGAENVLINGLVSDGRVVVRAIQENFSPGFHPPRLNVAWSEDGERWTRFYVGRRPMKSGRLTHDSEGFALRLSHPLRSLTFRSTDGKSWQPAPATTTPTEPPLSIDRVLATAAGLFGLGRRKVLFSDDGEEWSPSAAPWGSGRPSRSMAATDGTRLFYSPSGYRLWIRSAAGSWSESIQSSGNLNSIQWTSSGLLGARNDRLERSPDGNTWTLLASAAAGMTLQLAAEADGTTYALALGDRRARILRVDGSTLVEEWSGVARRGEQGWGLVQHDGDLFALVPGSSEEESAVVLQRAMNGTWSAVAATRWSGESTRLGSDGANLFVLDGALWDSAHANGIRYVTADGRIDRRTLLRAHDVVSWRDQTWVAVEGGVVTLEAF